MIQARDLCDMAQILNVSDPSTRYMRAAMWALHKARDEKYRALEKHMSPELEKLADGYERFLEGDEW